LRRPETEGGGRRHDRSLKRLSGQFSEVAQAMGAHSEKITDPQEIVPALKRGLAAVEGGKATVLEFITCDEGEYSKFSFR
jgi:thiamine pyrophosphate-dependent acetolactate synthase large subunit-like protein